MDIKEFMSLRAQSDEKFDSVILEPTKEELNQIYNLMRVFPNLTSIDYVPEKYLKLLSQFFGYQYLETEDPEVQREILKRLVGTYHKKGLVSELHKIANLGYNENYLIGDLTYYNGDMYEGYSSISYPRDFLFRYDYSKWDGGHRWPDDVEWRDGVVEIGISVPTDPTEKLTNLIDENLAAGLKYYLSILRDIGGNEIYVDMTHRILEDVYDQHIYIDIPEPKVYVQLSDFKWDYTEWDNSKIDGHSVISTDLWDEKKPQAGIYRVFYPIDCGYSVAEVWDEPFIDNWNRYCGIIGE